MDDSLGAATIGTENSDGTIGLQFANNDTPAVLDSMSIIWYGDDVNSATASINPDTVLRASSSNEYVYRITSISSSTSNMGKADHVVINNPFTDESISVVSVNIDGSSYFIQRSQSRPTAPQFASWWYYPTGDSLVIKTSYFAIKDSVVVTFLENGSAQTGSGNFTSTIDAAIGTSSAVNTTNGGYSVTVLPELIAYYTVVPAVLSTTAGTNVSVTVSAYDAGDNLVSWDDTTTVEFLTTGSRVRLSATEDNLSAGVASFTFADSAAENLTFTARSKYNTSVSGTSALVTVAAGGADTLLYQSGNGSVIAGTNQLLRVAVTDTFGNAKSSQTVNFIVRSGNGNLEGASNVFKITNVNGLAEATFTTGSTAGTNQVTAILVSSPSDSFRFTITGIPGGISYYTVTPAVYSALAGVNINVVVRAYDGNNNLVSSDNSTVVELIGSSANVIETPASQSLTAGVATFQVYDNTAESFTLTGWSQSDHAKQGVSGVVTVSSNAATNLSVSSGSGVSVVAGTDQLLRSLVTDAYGNVVNNESIRYRVISGGGNLGGLGVRTVSSGANGIAEATLTTGAVAGANLVAAVIVSSPADSIVFTVTGTAGGISYYTVTPAVYSALAGVNINVVVRAYDGNNNLVSSDNSTVVELIGSSANVIETPASQSLTAGVATFQVYDNTAESFTLTGWSQSDHAKQGVSGVVTVSSNAATNLSVSSGSGVSVVAGTDQLLRSLVTDAYGNVVNNESIRYRVISGGGNLGGLGVRTVSSGANGIAEATLTTGAVAGANLVAAVIVSSPADSIVFTVTGTAGGISYYTVTPAVYSALAGVNINVVVRAYDGNNNLVSSDNSTVVELIGSSANVIETPASQSLTAGVATFQVYDNTAESFTLTGWSQSDHAKQGVSGVVTVSSNAATNLSVSSGSGVSVVAGTDQLLRSLVTDAYGNVVNNESIRYRVISGGGNLGGLGVRTVSSGANGIAEATLTTGAVAGANLVAAVIVSSPADSIVFTVTGTAGGISYYTVTPAVYSALAGVNINVVVRAYDGNNNLVSSDNSTVVELIGSSANVIETPASQSLTAGVATFQVYDNTAESFTLTGWSQSDHAKQGVSGVVTVSSNAATNLSVSSGSGVSVVAGTDQLLRSLVTDAYGNVVNNESIRYRVISGGGNLGGLGVRTVSSGANGIAEATLTTGAVAGANLVAAVIVSSPADSIVFTVTGTAGGISYYTVTPAVYSALAGVNINVVVRAYDGNNNLVSSDNSTVVELIGSSANVIETPASQSLTAGVATFQVYDNTAESFTLTGWSQSDHAKQGVSGVVTVSSNAATNLSVSSGSGVSVVAGTDQLLRSLVTDAYGNVVNNESIRYRVISGGGNLGGLGVRTVSSGANGIAEATLTTGAVAGANLVAAVIVSSPADSIVFTVTGTAGGISYYTVTPAVYSALAGVNINVVVRAYDGNNNLVSSDNSTVVELIGSSANVIETPASQSLTAGVATFQVYDNTAESFTLTGWSQSDHAKQGVSGLITITSNSLDYVRIRTANNNQGVEFADSTITVTSSIVFYAAGYDQYANYTGNVTVNWSEIGLANSVSGSGSSYVFSPSIAPDAGRIIATSSIGGVTPDSTGTITITSGTLAELKIQTIRTAGQAFDDTTLTTDQTLTLYAVGYDLYGNYLGTRNANWFLNAPIGQFITANLLDSIVFDATTLGSGLIRAISTSNPSILDYTGLITVGTGTVASLVIRDAPDGAGAEFAADTIVVGDNLHFYSAGYDVNSNYVSDVNVDWQKTGTISGFTDSTNTSNLNIFPIAPGNGFIYTTNSSGWNNDSTGTIVIQPGGLTKLIIRTGPGGGGIELDTLTRIAGDSVALYAAGYDLENNYLGDQRVLWSTDGDPIGFFANSDSATFNRFYFRTVNSAIFRARHTVLGDISGLIRVRPANPDSIIIVGGGFVQTGSASSFVSDPPRIRVIDRFTNPVPNITVNWTTPSSSGQLDSGNKYY